MRPYAFALALLLAGACSSSSSSPQRSAAAADPARVQRFQVGGLEAFALDDGYLEVPNDGASFGAGRPAEETGALLAAAGLPREVLRLNIQVLLVKSNDRVILFDTGAGGDSMAKGGHLQASLARAGVTPARVTDIFISHAHFDHVGGLVSARGALVFPSATIHMAAPEWAAMQEKKDPKSIAPIIGPKVVPFDPGAQVLPEVKALATQGHTPGHSSYEVGSGADKLVYIGDLAHHYVVSVQRPAWSMAYDSDRSAAEVMRQQTLAKLASDHARVFAVHFPFPGIGHIEPRGETFVWQAEVIDAPVSR
ncbi:MAG TPA: MBL fold metallo-hydrolase [Kofleriaceae bacterium]|nr:MBL fold metallo-hydrolase [Kofleriaceae bacterium]